MRFFKWLLGIILVLVVAVFVGGFIFLKTFDLNKYKSLVEKIAYEQTGRKLSINGEANLGISLIPTLVINDVTFANPDWASHPNMAEIGSLELKVSIMPLFKKQVVVDKVALKNAKIYLQTTASGQNNWTFAPVAPQKNDEVKTSFVTDGWLISSANAAEIEAQTPAFLGMLSDVSINSVGIVNSSVEYEAAPAKPITVTVNSLTFSAQSINSPMNVSWNVSMDGMNTKGQATTGSLAGLFDGQTAWPVTAEVEALNVKANVKADLYDIMNKLRAEFSLNVYNPAGNFNAPETTLITAGKADLKTVALNISSLNVAGNVIKGSISADISGKVPSAVADLTSDKIDLRTLTPQAPLAAKLPSLISTAEASEYVPNDKIPFELLKTANADLKLAIKTLIVNDTMTVNDLNLKGQLKNGNLNIEPLQLRIGDGTINLNAVVNAATQSLTLKVNTKDLVLQQLHQEFVVKSNKDFGIVSGGKSEVFADLQGKGGTYRSLVDSLTGQVIAIVGQSELQTGELSFLNGNLVTQLLNVLKIDTKKVEKVSMKCAVVRADINKGKVDFPKGIAVDTDKMTLISNGTVNLPDDKLSLSLNAYRNGIADAGIVQALTNLIEIKGTLQNPKIGLDTNNAVKTIAGLMAGPAYTGAQMYLDRDPAPCYTALRETSFSSYFPKPSGVSNAAYQTYQGASDMVNGGINVAKDAAKGGYNIGKDAVEGGYTLGKDAVKGGYTLGKDAVEGSYNTGKDAAKDTAKMLENSAKKLLNNFLK